MNELLRDTLAEHADSAEPPALDLDGIVAAGDRRISRRRATAVLGGAVVTLAAIAGGVTAARSLDRRPAPATPPPFAERRATYAIGSQIHYGKDVISVAPHRVSALVQTDAGFVFLDDDNHIYVAGPAGVRRIAPGKGTGRLTADGHGSLVGWVEDYTDRSESVVYDVAADREVARTAIGNLRGPLLDAVMGPRVVAIDGDTAYFGTLKGLYRWDLKAGTGRFIAQLAPNVVRGVSSGQYLFQRPLQHPTSGTGLAVGPAPSDSARRTFPGRQGYLSPTADYLVAGPADNQRAEPAAAALDLYSVRSGARLALRHPDHPRLIFGQWLNDSTFTAVGVRAGQNAAVDLLTCSATTLACQVSTAAFSTFTFDPTPPRDLPFAVPLGVRITHYFG
ncbi:hypothetical protein ACIBG5_07615 [Kribbella sp. NPDC050241]|uniref:hypothetical protein n=1 Tax=Kribbella sp. NPDC050241 TaxID=3364115 RepID=UPI003792A429